MMNLRRRVGTIVGSCRDMGAGTQRLDWLGSSAQAGWRFWGETPVRHVKS